jgi:hypothetical protein
MTTARGALRVFLTNRFRPEAAVQIFAPTMTITLPDDLKHFIAEHGLFEGSTRNDSPGYVGFGPLRTFRRRTH